MDIYTEQHNIYGVGLLNITFKGALPHLIGITKYVLKSAYFYLVVEKI